MVEAHLSGCPISMPLDVFGEKRSPLILRGTLLPYVAPSLAWFVWVAGFVATSGGYDGSGPRFPCFTKGTGEPEIYVEDWHGYPCPEAGPQPTPRSRTLRREETTFVPPTDHPKVAR